MADCREDLPHPLHESPRQTDLDLRTEGRVSLPLRFTLEDALRAGDTWGANCGPGALAAICGVTLDELRPLLGDFEQKGYTNPQLMRATLLRLGVPFTLTSGEAAHTWPTHGLA